MHVRRADRRDAGEALGLHLHQALVAQPCERLADGCAAQPEPAAQLVVVERLARGERAVHDHLAELS